MTVRRADLYRIYAPYSRMAHLSFEGHIPICPRGKANPHCYDLNYWRGSGNQDEIDRANALPLCGECLDWVEAMYGPREPVAKPVEGATPKQIEQ